MKTPRLSIYLILGMLMVASAASAATYQISPEESLVDFKLTHRIGFTTGWIMVSNGSIETAEEEVKKLELILDTKTITTHNEDRDAVILSKDFFDAEAFPEIRLSARNIKNGPIKAEVTIKGKTKSVAFEFHLLGTEKTAEGKEKVYVFLLGTLNKQEFGFEYNITDDGGEPVLADDMQILLRLVGLE